MPRTAKSRLPRIDFSLDLAVRIEGIKLPFRLRCVTSDHDQLMGRLDQFWKLVKEKIHEIAQED
jgi:hypothetical protein